VISEKLMHPPTGVSFHKILPFFNGPAALFVVTSLTTPDDVIFNQFYFLNMLFGRHMISGCIELIFGIALVHNPFTVGAGLPILKLHGQLNCENNINAKSSGENVRSSFCEITAASSVRSIL
jgi:hypothetical protein